MPKIVWKEPKPGMARRSRPRSTREIKLEDPQDTPGLINGKPAGSTYEWNIARGLWTLGWEDFEYQVPLFGGRTRRGGVVLDFLLPPRPAQIVINPIGEYWHRNVSADKIEDARIIKRLGTGTRMLRPGTADCKTYEDALSYLTRTVGKY